MSQANSKHGLTANGNNEEATIESSEAAQQLHDFEEDILAKDVARMVLAISEPTPDLPNGGNGVQERTVASGTSRDSLVEMEASILAKVSTVSQPDASRSVIALEGTKMDECQDVELGFQDPDDTNLDKTKETQSRQAEDEINGVDVDNSTHLRDSIIDSIMPLPSRSGGSTQATQNDRNQPGAYAESGFGGRYGFSQPAPRRPVERTANPNIPEERESTSSLTVAHPVEGLDVHPDGELPLAIEVEQPTGINENREALAKRRRKETWMVFGYACIFLTGTVGFAILLTLLLPSKEDEITGSKDTIVSTSTSAPSLSWQSETLASFPDYTVQALKDSDSPQYKAFQWLMNDPSKETYPEWRLKQRFSLATLYYSTGGTKWVNNDLWLSYSHNECRWYGSDSFDVFDPNATYIELSHANACEEDADASETIGVYRHLWLRTNNLRGPIPSELFWLTSLRSINLDTNALTSSIPTHIGNLQELEAATLLKNDLTGRLPTEVGLLKGVTGIWVKGNQFQGTIPSELGNAMRLIFLDLEDVQFTGTIPTELGRLTDLNTFRLAGNTLNGKIPTELQNLSAVKDLMLGANDLSGSIPPEVLENLRKLKVLSLYGNRLTSTIPSAFGQLTELKMFSLYDNALTGPIPTEFGLLQSNLEWMFLDNNALDSTLPSELGLLRALTRLAVYGNGLTGSVPKEIESMATNGSLEEFILSNTMLTGILPPGLCTLPFLDFNCSEVLCGCECPCLYSDYTTAAAHDNSTIFK